MTLSLLTANIVSAHSVMLQEVQKSLEILRYLYWFLYGRFMGRRRSDK